MRHALPNTAPCRDPKSRGTPTMDSNNTRIHIPKAKSS